MNITQILVSAIGAIVPGNGGDEVGVVTMTINDARTIAQTFAQLPDLQNAISAPNVGALVYYLGLFLTDPGEVSAFTSMLGSIASDAYESTFQGQILDKLGGAWGLFFSAIESLYNAEQQASGIDYGTVTLTAQ